MGALLTKVALAFAILVSERVHAAECANPDAAIAEVLSGHPRSWEELHNLFKKFPGCDDGVIAEGYSDFVARALAKQWPRLPELRKLIAQDPAFRAFVLLHIDATADSDDLSKAAANAREQCPSGAAELCSAIRSAAEKAIRVP